MSKINVEKILQKWQVGGLMEDIPQLKSAIKEIIEAVIDKCAEVPIIEIHEHRIYKADKESILKIKQEIDYS